MISGLVSEGVQVLHRERRSSINNLQMDVERKHSAVKWALLESIVLNVSGSDGMMLLLQCQFEILNCSSQRANQLKASFHFPTE